MRRNVRADAARERDTLREHHQAELAAARALTDAERARAERAEAQLDTERADRRTLTSHLTAATGNGQAPQFTAHAPDRNHNQTPRKAAQKPMRSRIE